MRDLFFTMIVCTNPEFRRHPFTFPGGEGGPAQPVDEGKRRGANVRTCLKRAFISSNHPKSYRYVVKCFRTQCENHI